MVKWGAWLVDDGDGGWLQFLDEDDEAGFVGEWDQHTP